MKSLVMILTGLFSFFLFDFQLHRRQKRDLIYSSFSEIDLSEKKEKTKKIKRKYTNKKYKQRKIYPLKRLKYKNVKPKDNRFSNQKSLRKMYRNS